MKQIFPCTWLKSDRNEIFSLCQQVAQTWIISKNPAGASVIDAGVKSDGCKGHPSVTSSGGATFLFFLFEIGGGAAA